MDKNLENNRRKVICNKFCSYKPTIMSHVTNPNSNVLGDSCESATLKKIFLVFIQLSETLPIELTRSKKKILFS